MTKPGPKEDAEMLLMQKLKAQQESHEVFASQEDNQNSEMNFTVPPEVLGKIDEANTLSRNETGGLR